MWEYKILKSDLGYSIYRKREEGKFIYVEYLNGDGKWVLSRDSARVFHTEDDVKSAFIVCRRKGNEEDTTLEDNSESIPEEKVEKQSRSEF